MRQDHVVHLVGLGRCGLQKLYPFLTRTHHHIMAAPENNSQEQREVELQKARSVLSQTLSLPKGFRRLQDDAEDTDDDDINGLPFIGSRNAKWWYATYHSVTANVGVGVLGLPATMAYLGWGVGTTIQAVSWVITIFTLWQMVQMHEMEENNWKRADTYHALGQRAFGPKLGLYIVVPQQLLVEVGLDVVYMVTAGQCLWNFYRLVACRHISPANILGNGECCGTIGSTVFIIIFAVPQVFLAQLGNFNSIAGVSLAASIMSICYCTITWSISLSEGHNNHGPNSIIGPVSYDFPDTTTANKLFGALNALGIVSFAYSGHNVVLEIQATLPSTKDKRSKVAMWRGCMVAYAVLAFCYYPVSFASYWAFGNSLALNNSHHYNPSEGNILLRLRHPRWLLASANLMVAVHMVGSYQLYAMPVFNMMESLLIKKFRFRPTPPGSTSWTRIVTRSTYVFITAFLACTFPFFHSLLGFVGGLALAPTSHFLPSIIWLKIKRPPVGIVWFINWAVIIFGILLMVVATIGGARSFSVQVKNLQYYQFTADSCRA